MSVHQIEGKYYHLIGDPAAISAIAVAKNDQMENWKVVIQRGGGCPAERGGQV